MNLFKKTTATVALVTLVSGLFSAGVSANSTSQIEAANALAAVGYINDHSDDVAAYNLNQNVLRQEIAAVARGLAKIAKKTTCDNEFSDVTATTPNNWACYTVEALADANLIAKNPKFNPEQNITKAEAVAMMVKATFPDYAYDASKSTSWQEQVVAFAVNKAIVPNFTNYNTPATRGFVFEAGNNAMVAASEVVTDTCDEVSQLLGLCGDTTNTDTNTNDNTSTDTNDNTSTDTTTTTSSLEVTTSPLSLTDGSQIPKSGTIRFAKVDFTAGNEDVSVNTIEVSKLTLASIKSGTRIWFEKNGRRISGKAAFSSDNTAIISFAPALNVMAGETETLDLYVELPSGSYGAGNDLQFTGKVTDASVTVDGSFVTPLLTTADYAVSKSAFSGTTSGASYNDLSNALTLGKFTIKNSKDSGVTETRDETFQSVTFRQTGDGDLTNLSDLTIVRNGDVVAKNPVIDGKYVTFEVNDVIKDSTTATYYIKAMVDTVDNNAGDTYKFELKKDTDLNVVETVTGFRTTVTANPKVLAKYTVNGSDVTFERDSSVELSQNVAIWTTNVTLLKGTISSTTSITLEDPTLGYTTDPTASWSDLFNNVYLKIGSTIMTWTPTASDTTAKFLGLVTLPAGTSDVEIYADVKDNASTTTFKFNDLNLDKFATKEYTSNQNTISSTVGSIAGVSVSIDETKLSINKTDGLGNTTIAQGTKGEVLNTLSLKVTQGNDVQVSNASYTVNYTGSGKNNAFLTLYANDAAIQTKTVDVDSGSTISFDTLNETISDTPVTLTVKADFSDAFNSGSFSVTLADLDATDVLTSKDVNLGTIPTSAVFTVKQAVGTLSASDNNPHAKLILAGSTAEQLLAFRLRATNDDVKLRDLVFTWANLNNLNNFKITDVNGTVVADSATTATSTGVTFKNLNVSDVVTKDSTKTYYIIADANLNTSVTGVYINLAKTGSTIKSSNGSVIAMVGDNVTSNIDRIEENMAVIAKDSNSDKDLANSAIRFSITASGNDKVTLAKITVKPNISGYKDGTTSWSTMTGVLSIYKDSVSDSNLVGTGVYTNNQAVDFDADNYNTIDAGSTNHYIVTFNNVVIDSNANSSDWSVNITDSIVDLDGNTANGTTGNVNVSSYDNMGTLPLTEVK